MRGLVVILILVIVGIVVGAAPDPQLFRQQLTPIQLRAKQTVFALLITHTDGKGALCTGFLIDEEGETLMVTAGHCCNDVTTIGAIRQNSIYPVDILSFSPRSKEHDACILKPSKSMAAMPLKLRLAADNEVMYLGRPLAAYGYVQEVGIVQIDLLSLGIQQVNSLENSLRLIAADGEVRPGMSGGPVLNSIGEVVGNITATNAEAERSYHTPVSDIRKAISACRASKKCSKP